MIRSIEQTENKYGFRRVFVAFDCTDLTVLSCTLSDKAFKSLILLIAQDADGDGLPERFFLDHLEESPELCNFFERCDGGLWRTTFRAGIREQGERIDLTTEQWKKIRMRVIKEDGTTCNYCGCDCSSDPTVDHVVPVSRGGTHARQNLVVACRSCNSSKGNR